MKIFYGGFAGLLCLAASALAQPKVDAWQMNYSFTLPKTPHYAAAQGSIIVIYGSGMGPATLLSQGFNPALDKNLGGVSIKVTVAATTTEAIPYYVSATQIAAILPSATPVGNGTLTVTYNGQTSASIPIRVVQSNLGILTLNGAGTGTAAVYDLNYQYVTPTNAANPGQSIIFWGTGLGPDPNDETRLITGAKSLDTIPFEFYIGGKRANVTYRGRSPYPGLDQINVVVPDGVSGCAVAAYSKSTTWVSNMTTIPVAASGRICSDPSGFSSGDISRLQNLSQINIGSLSLGKATAAQGPISLTSDNATAMFARYTPIDFTNNASGGQASIGSCMVSTYTGSSGAPPTSPGIKLLDAGAVTLRLPDSSTRTLARQQGIYSYSGVSLGGNPLFIPASGGDFTYNIGGGADVGAFSAGLSAFPAINWTNKSSISNINRSSSLDVTWTPGPASAYMVIAGVSIITGPPSLATSFVCTADAAAGRFTIPADVLSKMVQSEVISGGGITIATGQLSLMMYSNPKFTTGPGLDIVSTTYFNSDSAAVNYQ
ncbi:MAG: hypothetical protein IT168_12410 [Bryobacterales bacterium]|nr:hypothetical protein [Bryobacterales bacterium]